jgi:glycosyltransferase involved in cell wall biosynthesis
MNKISIIIPSYNQAKYVEKTILSVINQDYINKEIIFIDGCSSDGTVEIASKYKKYFKKFVSEKDLGQSDAIHKGFEFATGDVLCWINTDDIFLPGALSSVMEAFNTKKNIDFLVGHTLIINEKNKIWTNKIGLPVCTIASKPSIKKCLLWGSGFNQPSSFWTRRAYDKTSGIRKSLIFCMDRCNELQILENHSTYVLNKYLSCFRVHSDSKTSNLANIRAKEMELLDNEFGITNYGFYNKHLSKIGYQIEWRIKNTIGGILLKKKKWEKIIEDISANLWR